MTTQSGLLAPAAAPRLARLAVCALPLLAVSAALIVAAAWAMPEPYSWLTLSISESAAQGQRNGWIGRLGFLCYGAGVLLVSLAMRGRWPRLTYWSGLVFAASMPGVAAFSHAPWQPGVPADAFEDMLHSLFASGMGTAFCVAVVARSVHRGRGAVAARAFDAIALLLALAVPALFASGYELSGMLQRVMFCAGYVWFGHEAILGARPPGDRGDGQG